MTKRMLVISHILALTWLVLGSAGAALAQSAAGVGGASAWQEIVQVMLIPWVTFLVLTFGMVLLIYDLLTIRTWGPSGTAGVLLLGLVFTSYVSAGVAGWHGVLIFLVGLGLVLVEAHVFPGHGISGIAGVVCLFLGLFWALGGTTVNALFAAVTSAVFTLMAIAAFLVHLPKTSRWRALGQQLEQRVGMAYVSVEDAPDYVGDTGKAVTALKPSGTGEFNGRRLEVVSEVGYIPPGTDVRAVRMEGDKLIVRDASVAAQRGSHITLGDG